jgi:hypothetical protein
MKSIALPHRGRICGSSRDVGELFVQRVGAAEEQGSGHARRSLSRKRTGLAPAGDKQAASRDRR